MTSLWNSGIRSGEQAKSLSPQSQFAALIATSMEQLQLAPQQGGLATIQSVNCSTNSADKKSAWGVSSRWSARPMAPRC